MARPARRRSECEHPIDATVEAATKIEQAAVRIDQAKIAQAGAKIAQVASSQASMIAWAARGALRTKATTGITAGLTPSTPWITPSGASRKPGTFAAETQRSPARCGRTERSPRCLNPAASAKTKSS